MIQLASYTMSILSTNKRLHLFMQVTTYKVVHSRRGHIQTRWSRQENVSGSGGWSECIRCQVGIRHLVSVEVEWRWTKHVVRYVNAETALISSWSVETNVVPSLVHVTNKEYKTMNATMHGNLLLIIMDF